MLESFGDSQAKSVIVTVSRYVDLILRTLLIPLAAIFAGLIFVSPLCYWTDSEIWAVSSSSRYFIDPENFEFEMKPLFNLILAVVGWVAKNIDLYFMIAARLFFAVNASAILVLVYLIAKRITAKKTFSYFAVGVLLTSVQFVQQIYRVRSDMLVTTAILIMLLYLVEKSRPGEQSLSSQNIRKSDVVLRKLSWVGQYRKLILTLAILLNAIALTPNAFVIILAMSPIWSVVIVESFQQTGDGKDLYKCTKFILFMSLLLLLPIGYQWWEGLANSLRYILETFGAESTGWPYWSLVRFEHLIWFAMRDIPFTCAIVGAVVITAIRWKSRNTFEHRYMLSSVFLLLLLIFHPVKLPFMIGSYLPFFSLFTTVSLFEFKRRWLDQRAHVYTVMAKVTLICLFVWSSRLAMRSEYSIKEHHNSRNQLSVIQYLNSYLKMFGRPSYYDVIGMLPDFAPTSGFVGPGQIEANQFAANELAGGRFDFVFYVYKMTMIEDLIQKTLNEKYLNAGQGVYVRAYSVSRQFLELDSNRAISIEDFIKKIRSRWLLSSPEKLLLCVRAEDQSRNDITSSIKITHGHSDTTSMKMDSSGLVSESGTLTFPSNFFRIQISRFGCPKIPGELTMQQLFNFDSTF